MEVIIPDMACQHCGETMRGIKNLSARRMCDDCIEEGCKELKQYLEQEKGDE